MNIVNLSLTKLFLVTGTVLLFCVLGIQVTSAQMSDTAPSCSVSVDSDKKAVGDLIILSVESNNANEGTYHCNYKQGSSANSLTTVNGITVIPTQGEGEYTCTVYVIGDMGKNTCETRFDVKGISLSSAPGYAKDKSSQLIDLLRQLVLLYQLKLQIDLGI